MYPIIKKISLTFIIFNVFMFQSVMADMLFYYSAAVLPSIISTQKANNIVPVADAGVEQGVPTVSTVILNGSESYDTDGDTLTYSWSLVEKPEGSTATLSNSTTFNPTFTADKDGSYVVELIVNDGTVDSAADYVVITSSIGNIVPVANAGDDQSVPTASTVTLNGSDSYDADGDTLTYSWSITSKPEGSTATLSSTTIVKPSFSADKDGSYIVQLIVYDGIANSTPDIVVIVGTTTNSAPVANAGLDKNVHTTGVCRK